MADAVIEANQGVSDAQAEDTAAPVDDAANVSENA